MPEWKAKVWFPKYTNFFISTLFGVETHNSSVYARANFHNNIELFWWLRAFNEHQNTFWVFLSLFLYRSTLEICHKRCLHLAHTFKFLDSRLAFLKSALFPSWIIWLSSLHFSGNVRVIILWFYRSFYFMNRKKSMWHRMEICIIPVRCHIIICYPHILTFVMIVNKGRFNGLIQLSFK